MSAAMSVKKWLHNGGCPHVRQRSRGLHSTLKQRQQLFDLDRKRAVEHQRWLLADEARSEIDSCELLSIQCGKLESILETLKIRLTECAELFST